jgi:hypothetical protein
VVVEGSKCRTRFGRHYDLSRPKWPFAEIGWQLTTEVAIGRNKAQDEHRPFIENR